MSDALAAYVATTLDAPVADHVRRLAVELAGADAVAVLFYGSNLRTGSTEGVLDFYVLTAGPTERGLWPRVGYREIVLDGRIFRAKIATMRLATFAEAARGTLLDTTIWTRFVQPAALVRVAEPATRDTVVAAVAAAAVTAARFAAALGPVRGTAAEYWRALFRQTYAAEFRVEKPGREEQILHHGAGRYDALLPLAWDAAGIAFDRQDGVYTPVLPDRAAILAAWRRRRRLGKPLNLIRLIRATWTFEGAGDYGAWKLERHTGVAVAMTPWRRRHPILAAPGVFWRLWRAQR